MHSLKEMYDRAAAGGKGVQPIIIGGEGVSGDALQASRDAAGLPTFTLAPSRFEQLAGAMQAGVLKEVAFAQASHWQCS